MKVERMLNLAEYKRRQAAPGVKVTLKNFGRDRRYPIVNRFRDPGTPLPQPDRSLLKDGAAAAKERGVRFLNWIDLIDRALARSSVVPAGSVGADRMRTVTLGPAVRRLDSCRLLSRRSAAAALRCGGRRALRGAAWPLRGAGARIGLPCASVAAATAAWRAPRSTTMSPRSTVWSSSCLSASAQVWPAPCSCRPD